MELIQVVGSFFIWILHPIEKVARFSKLRTSAQRPETNWQVHRWHLWVSRFISRSAVLKLMIWLIRQPVAQNYVQKGRKVSSSSCSSSSLFLSSQILKEISTTNISGLNSFFLEALNPVLPVLPSSNRSSSSTSNPHDNLGLERRFRVRATQKKENLAERLWSSVDDAWDTSLAWPFDDRLQTQFH